MRQDYYDVLGVSRGASLDEIRGAFRSLARAHHPDLNSDDPTAESRFKEINEAYEVLRDSDKRAMYDRFGHAGVKGSGQPGPGVYPDFGDLGEIFEQFFGFGARSRANGPRSEERGADRRANMKLEFQDAVFGATKQLALGRLERCGECEGSGARPGTKSLRCDMCQGRGQVRNVQQSAFGAFVNVQTCPGCGGRGEVMPEPCQACGGEGRARRQRTLEVDIPAGVEDGTQIRLSGEGDVGRWGGPAGNLYVVMEVAEHPVFERLGNDVHLQLSLNPAEAALGAALEIPTLDGAEELSVPAGAQTGDRIRLEGRGVPRLRRNGRGDQIVTVVVATPNKLTPEQQELFEELRATLPVASVIERNRGFWSKVKERFG